MPTFITKYKLSKDGYGYGKDFIKNKMWPTFPFTMHNFQKAFCNGCPQNFTAASFSTAYSGSCLEVYACWMLSSGLEIIAYGNIE